MRAGSVCSGYGGLDMAAAELLDTELAWVADNDSAAAKVLAHHHPDVPNLGDITRVGLPYSDDEWAAMRRRAEADPAYAMPTPDWSSVEPVDVLTAGFPCQDLSTAGKRAGLVNGKRSSLWHEVERAIAYLRPSLLLIENVRGLLSGKDTVDEPNDVCVCGWPYRRGGMHPDQPLGRDIPSGCDCGDDLEGSGGAGADEEVLRRFDQVLAGSDGPLGFGLGVDGGGSKREGVAARCGAVSGSEGRAGSDSAEGGGDPGGPRALGGSQATAMDRCGEGSLRGAEAQDARVEREGAYDAVTGERHTDCPACGRNLGDGSSRSVQRSWMGTVLWSLARLGYDAVWCCLPASAVGCAHLRWRVFLAAADTQDVGHQRSWLARGRRVGSPVGSGFAAADTAGAGRRRSGSVGSGTAAGVECEARKRPAGRGGESPAADADCDGRERGEERDREPGDDGTPLGDDVERLRLEGVDWRQYRAAIRQHERMIGRSAPAPTIVGKRGGPKLSPYFTEWLMGLPAGHVTGVPGLSVNDMLRLCGNGVVPQQAVAAYRYLLPLLFNIDFSERAA